MSELAAHLADVLAPLGRVTWRPFFGGRALCLGAVQFAYERDGTVWLRSDTALAAELEGLGGRAFEYDTRKRTVRVASYWSVPDAGLDDEERLVAWARRALRAARAARK